MRVVPNTEESNFLTSDFLLVYFKSAARTNDEDAAAFINV